MLTITAGQRLAKFAAARRIELHAVGHAGGYQARDIEPKAPTSA